MAHSSPSPPTQAYQSLFSRGLFGFLDKDTEASESWKSRGTGRLQERDSSPSLGKRCRSACRQTWPCTLTTHVKKKICPCTQTHRASAVKRGFLGRRLVPLGSRWRGDPGPLPEANPTSTQRKRMGKAPSCLKTKREGRNLR